MSVFEANVDAIIEELELRLKEVAHLENRVVRAYPSTTTEYPTVHLHLERVEVDVEGADALPQRPSWIYTLEFLLNFQDRWRDDESAIINEEEKVKRLGEVLDKIRSYAVNIPKWDLMWFSAVEYSQLERRANYVLLDADVELRVRKRW